MKFTDLTKKKSGLWKVNKMSSSENKRPTKDQVENDYDYDQNYEIVRAVERGDFYFLNRELLGSKKRTMSKELAAAMIESISEETYFHQSSANMATVIPVFISLSKDEYNEIHRLLLEKVFEMKSHFYGGFVISAMVKLLVERDEYEWAVNFSTKFFKYLDEEWQTCGYSRLSEFDPIYLCEIKFHGNPARMTKERCIEKIAERQYLKGEKSDSLENFKKALTTGTREDAKRTVVAMALNFFKKQKDTEMFEEILAYSKETFSDDNEFIKFADWLSETLSKRKIRKSKYTS